MGFRLIKSGQKNLNDQRVFLKKQELAKEAKRWANLAGHSSEAFDQFLTHFEEVLHKSERGHSSASMVCDLSQKIRGAHTRLDYVQGNLSLSHIDELLSGYCPPKS